MKDFLKGLAVFIIISCFSVVIPYMLLNKAENYSYDNMKVEELGVKGEGEYFQNISNIINNNLDNQEIRSSAVTVQAVAGEYYDVMNNTVKIIICYFELVMVVSLIGIGIYGLKKSDKKYVSKALITSGTFTLIVVIINVINYYITHNG